MRESPAVYLANDLEFPVDDTLNSGGLAAERPELSEAPHPRERDPSRCGRGSFQGVLLQAASVTKALRACAALGRLRLGPAKHPNPESRGWFSHRHLPIFMATPQRKRSDAQGAVTSPCRIRIEANTTMVAGLAQTLPDVEKT